MEPTQKSPELEAKLEQIAGRTTAIHSLKCVRPPIGCGGTVKGFRDALSEREYRISGFCQECQDEIWKPLS